ncbi:MAG: alcohol dehydrogenase catalytic domain-containing protein [Planctomycetota bacterium]|nr:alcohol dehydrogenase catalytic domain-containing protein [Planctomycetota bacterium]
MPWSARRIRMPEPRRCELEAFTVPDPGPGEAVVGTAWSLVSPGTELAVYTGIHQGLTNPQMSWPKFPFLAGYSAAGTILAVGPGVASLATGDRVAFPGHHASHGIVKESAPHLLKLPDGLETREAAFLRCCASPSSRCSRPARLWGRRWPCRGWG